MADVETLQRVFTNALSSETFERHGTRMGTWNIAGNCEKPVPLTKWSRSTGNGGKLAKAGIAKVPMIELNFLTKCRKCRVCLREKATLWRYRAIAEMEVAERTWFGTLTLSPEHHYAIDCACSTKIGDFWNQPQGKKFEMQAREIGKEVTKYLKRIRKNSGCHIRYLLVTEIHDGARTSVEMRGRAHMHLLIHERPGEPVRKQLLDDNWHLGFTKWKLASGVDAAWYLSKYISKAMDVRTRASIGYGSYNDDEWE